MPLFPNSTNQPPVGGSTTPFGQRPQRPRQPWETPEYLGGNSGYRPPGQAAPPPAPQYRPPSNFNAPEVTRRPRVAGVPSPIFNSAVRNGAPQTNQPAPPPPPAPYRPSGGPRSFSAQSGVGNAPRIESQWNQLQQDNFNALSGIDPTLIWANQYNAANGLNPAGQEAYGGDEAGVVASLLPPRLMAEVNNGKPLHMALIQYMQFLRGLGLGQV